jgi:hypothetical protein
MSFVVKSWDVFVDGYGPGYGFIAKTRGKALAGAWRCDAFNAITFGQFLKIAQCRRGQDRPDFGRPITANGRPAFFVGSNRQYVQFVWPDGDVVFNSHPFDVEPNEVRPSTYRPAS